MIKINSTVVDGCGDNEYILSFPYSQRYLLHTYVEKSGQFFISQMGPALAILYTFLKTGWMIFF
jgi:hypothetical protein